MLVLFKKTININITINKYFKTRYVFQEFFSMETFTLHHLTSIINVAIHRPPAKRPNPSESLTL